MYSKDLQDHRALQAHQDTAGGLVPMTTPQTWWNTSDVSGGWKQTYKTPVTV